MLVVLLLIVITVETVVLAAKLRPNKVHYDGTVQVLEDDGTKTFSFEPDGDLYDLDQRKEVRLKVELHSTAGDRA